MRCSPVLFIGYDLATTAGGMPPVASPAAVACTHTGSPVLIRDETKRVGSASSLLNRLRPAAGIIQGASTSYGHAAWDLAASNCMHFIQKRTSTSHTPARLPAGIINGARARAAGMLHATLPPTAAFIPYRNEYQSHTSLIARRYH